MFRTFTLRLRPNKAQVAAFEYILADSCETYNAALQERREAWKLQRKSISLYEQFKELAELRKDPRFATIASNIQRDPLRRLDMAFKGFFRRCKSGQTPGFPRFRAVRRYRSFAFPNPILKLDHLNVPKVGRLRFRCGRDMVGIPKRAVVKHLGNRWIAQISCDVGPPPAKLVVSCPVGIDVGLTNFITVSNGLSVENPRWTRKHAAKIAAANRSLGRKQKRSKNRLRALEVLRRAHQRAADARRNFTHHVSKWLVSNYDLIAYEKLKITRMVHGKLAKSILDAAWGELIWQISYKAESAGRWAIPINPRGTSIRCSTCGAEVRKTLRERQHNCACGTSLNRDHNAALNILALGKSAAGLGPSERLALSAG